MGQCGPIDPCQECSATYAKDPRYVPDERRQGSFRIAHDEDHRKRHGRRTNLNLVEDRLPVPTTSRRQTKARRRAKMRRRS